MSTKRRVRHHLCQGLVDRVSAATGLILLLPVFAAVALLIVSVDGRPIFFTQLRVGRKGKLFNICKFRTMMRATDGAVITAARDPRITRLGSFLRRFKLDELPQLLNVLKGEMSLIGPRPEVPEYVDYDAPIWKAVLSVRPGITDPATLIYRNEESLLGSCGSLAEFYRKRVLPKKLMVSVRYLQSRSFRTDVRLIMLTAGCSMSGRTPEMASFAKLFNRKAVHR